MTVTNHYVPQYGVQLTRRVEVNLQTLRPVIEWQPSRT